MSPLQAVPEQLAGLGQWSVAWRRFRKNKSALAGCVVVGFFLFIALLDRLVALYPPNCLVGLQLHCPSSAGYQVRSPPSFDHPLGTNYVGQDVYSQLVYGAKNAFIIGLGASIVAMTIAVIISLIAGYYGGHADNTLMRLTEVFLIIPFFLVLLVLLRISNAISAGGGGLPALVTVIGVFSWAWNARLIRSEVLRVRQLEFVEAAQQLGAGPTRIIFRHLLPNALHIIIVLSTLQIATSVLIEAGVSFLGFGDPNLITWGQQIANASTAVREAWWEGVFPGLSLTALVMGFKLVGNGLRDAIDPRLRE